MLSAMRTTTCNVEPIIQRPELQHMHMLANHIAPDNVLSICLESKLLAFLETTSSASVLVGIWV